MRLALPFLFCPLVLGVAAACDEEGGQIPNPAPENTGGAWAASGGAASGGHDANVDGSGGMFMAGGPATDDDTDPMGSPPFRCDAAPDVPNPWLAPNTDASRRAVFKPSGAQCGPGVEVDVWGGYFNEIFVDCRDWPFPWPGSGEGKTLSDFAVRSLVLKEALQAGEPFSVSTDIVSPRPARVELWGTCASCGSALEFLGAQDIEPGSTGVGVCFEINATAPHSHLLLLLSDVDAAHGHIRFCAGQACPIAQAP